MELSKLIEGLQILKPHYKGGDGHHTGAEHDIIYAYSTDTPLSAVEVEHLYELGWHQPEVPNNEDTDEHGPYDPEEGWAAFT